MSLQRTLKNERDKFSKVEENYINELNKLKQENSDLKNENDDLKVLCENHKVLLFYYRINMILIKE